MNSCYAVLFFQILSVILKLSSLSVYYGTRRNERNDWEGIPQSNRVSVNVFYETLCPGSIHFFVKELRPVVEQLSSHLDLHLVPFGFAKTRTSMFGRYAFQCQHGPDECYGNRIHACVLDELKNNTKAALLNSCLMEYTKITRVNGLSYASVMNWCAYQQNIKTHRIWDCIHSERSSILLKNHGEETRARRPRYVPYVQIYDSQGIPRELTGDLMTELCVKLKFQPSPCQRYMQKITLRIK